MTFSFTTTRLAAAGAAAGACALLTACGSSAAPSPTATATVTAPPAASASSVPASSAPASPSSPPATTAAAPRCLASGLGAKLGASQGTAGTIYQVVVLTNTSASTCSLYGYPGVSFVTGVGGSQVGAPAAKDAMSPNSLVTLAPGGQASLLLAVHDAGAFPNCKPSSVGWLRIYPPGDYSSVYVKYKTQACANKAEVTLGVSPMRAGAGTASG